MNSIIEQANKDLAKIFGLCWHEFDNGEWLVAAYPCDEERCMHCKASNLYAPRPDFRKIVDIKCEECEGSGCSPKSRDDYCLACDLKTDAQCNFFITCSHCNGTGSRFITELQMHAERNNTWEKFLWSLSYLSDIRRSFFVITDINQLLVKYRDWRQKHEAQKA
jgi:hypothetical protein